MASKYKYINIEQMKRIDALSSTGQYSQLQIAERVGCSPATVSRVRQALRGERHEHIGNRIMNMAKNYKYFEKDLETRESDTLSIASRLDIATSKLVSLQSTLASFKSAFDEVNSEIKEVTHSVEALTQKL